MNLIDKVKAAQIAARKARDADTAASLTTLIGEAEAIGKNDGNRPVTDLEVTALLKKFIKNNRETANAMLKIMSAGSEIAKVDAEFALYESFLPKQLTEAELSTLIDQLVSDGAKDVGDAMKLLKTNHAGTYDGATASKLLKLKFSK